MSRGRLLAAGFTRVGCYRRGVFEGDPPRGPGVYVFATAGALVYVGAARRLRARLRSYGVPRPAGRPARPVHHALLAEELVEVLALSPVPDGVHHGLPVDGVAGLEAGLIRDLDPLWNRRI